jgi:hypothetical protein
VGEILPSNVDDRRFASERKTESGPTFEADMDPTWLDFVADFGIQVLGQLVELGLHR